MFRRLLELKAKYTAALSHTNGEHAPDGASALTSSHGLVPRPIKRRKVGLDSEELHRVLKSIFLIHRGAVHFDVLVAAVQPSWVKLSGDEPSPGTLHEIRQVLRHHLNSFRVDDSRPTYQLSEAHLWFLNASSSPSLEDKDGVLLLPAAAESLSLGSAVRLAMNSLSELSQNQQSILLEDKVRQWLVGHGWADLRAADPPTFDQQVACVLRFHAGERLGFTGSTEDDADDEDLDADGGDMTVSGRRARPPRRLSNGSPRGSSSSVPLGHSGSSGSSYPAGSAAQAAKQRRLHQIHQIHPRAPPTHRQRQRAQKNRVAPGRSASPSASVTVSAGVLGLHLSRAASIGLQAVPIGAVCNQCGAAVLDSAWYRGPNLSTWHCAACGENWSREHSCPVCGLVYDEEDDGDELPLSSDLFHSLQVPVDLGIQLPSLAAVDLAGIPEQSSWIACDDCGRWVMTKCDGIADLSLYDDENPNHLPYHCPLCRGTRKSIPRIFFTRQSAPAFVSLFLVSRPSELGDSVTSVAAVVAEAEAPVRLLEPLQKRAGAQKLRVQADELAQEVSMPEPPLLVSLSSVSIDALPLKTRNEGVYRVSRAEKILLDAWQQRRAQLDETSDRRVTKSKMDKIKQLEKKFVDDVGLVRDSLARALNAMLDRNKSELEVQVSRVKKEKETLDQLAEAEITRELDVFVRVQSEKLNAAAESILGREVEDGI